MEFIKWCNENNGFLTAILSIIGLLLSTIAIVVSISTARLPYKKRLLLGSSLLIGTSIGANIQVLGLSASATNIGNRTINISYLGYALKKDGRLQKLNPINRVFNASAKLEPSEKHEVEFYRDELLGTLSQENQNAMLFIIAIDTEGTIYKQKTGTIGRLMSNLSE